MITSHLWAIEKGDLAGEWIMHNGDNITVISENDNVLIIDNSLSSNKSVSINIRISDMKIGDDGTAKGELVDVKTGKKHSYSLTLKDANTIVIKQNRSLLCSKKYHFTRKVSIKEGWYRIL